MSLFEYSPSLQTPLCCHCLKNVFFLPFGTFLRLPFSHLGDAEGLGGQGSKTRARLSFFFATPALCVSVSTSPSSLVCFPLTSLCLFCHYTQLLYGVYVCYLQYYIHRVRVPWRLTQTKNTRRNSEAEKCRITSNFGEDDRRGCALGGSYLNFITGCRG